MKVALILVVALAFASAGKNITTRSGVQSIVGGSEAVRHSYPWIVARAQGITFEISKLRADWNQGLASNVYSIGAQHMYNSRNICCRRRTQIRLGDHNIFVSEGTEQDIRSQRIYIHPGYDAVSFEYDVALIRISRRVTFTDQVEVGKLTTSGLIGDEELTAIGWGLLEEDGDLSPTLQEVEVMAQSEATCESIYPFFFDPVSMFCAGPKKGGQGTCQGDSGSPVLIDRGSGLEIVGYDAVSFEYDVALIRISRRVTFTDQVEVGKLTTSGLIGDEELTAIGWGLLEEDGDLSPTLQEVEVMAKSEATCESIYPFFFDPVSLFCAGPKKGGQGTCQGDSGSPVLIDRGSGLEIVGIVSWGVGCARSGYPGVHADVYKALDWINPIINS